MAEEDKNIETETDIFQQQKKTIDTLIDVLEKQGSGGQQPQVVYTQPVQQEKSTPNYMMYIGIAAVILFIFLRGK